MKHLILSLILITTNAFAFSEIQCRGSQLDLDLDFWGSNTSNVRADLVYIENGNRNRHSFTMRKRNSRTYIQRYYGGGNRLEIDTWPDEEMQPLRQYRAIFESRLTGFQRISCTYWD